MHSLIDVLLGVLKSLLSLLFHLLFLWAERHPSHSLANHCVRFGLQRPYWHLFSAIFNLLGHPGLLVPCYLAPEGRDIQM